MSLTGFLIEMTMRERKSVRDLERRVGRLIKARGSATTAKDGSIEGGAVVGRLRVRQYLGPYEKSTSVVEVFWCERLVWRKGDEAHDIEGPQTFVEVDIDGVWRKILRDAVPLEPET